MVPKMKKSIDYPLVVIGAGAAGIGASIKAGESGIPHIVLEASHRAGGRGLTEYVDGIPVDLGCHWMHCASRNPYVQIADALGFDYSRIENYEYEMFFDGSWLFQDEWQEFKRFREDSFRRVENLYTVDPSASVFDALDNDSKWTGHMHYWWSLLHSNDVDQISVQDPCEFDETDEDWPVRQGYGALIEKQSETCPIQFNTEVRAIDYTHSPVRIETGGGVIRADKVIVTVSTGVLSSGRIHFRPALPCWKRESIEALPLGNSNYQFFSFEPGTFGPDPPENIHYQQEDVSMAIRMRPFGTNCVFTSTGGRFAWWLEKQGVSASRAYLEEALVRIFGTSIRQGLREFKVSAWGYDPLICGAYSSQKPGYRDMRKQLAKPVNEALYFAGEATSVQYMNTAHGAYLSGRHSVELIP
ncbi:MAG: FAD-dependent oxidoreductase [Gammaproteobacteria bacterium]|nr:FAD-dependent oxidoreductase [Gammaproteobacteria bacterium]